MAGDIFQPQVAELTTSVTPQQGVVDTGPVDLFLDVAKVAAEATLSFTGQRELSDLQGKFGNIVQARAQGGNSSALQIKARAALDEAKSNSPWVAQQADKLFRDTFGGGTAGGVFKNTPEEEAREKHLQRVEETRLALNLPTSEEAQKRISLDENAKSAKIQADAQKDVREYNGEVVFSNTQTQLNNNSIKFMDAVSRANMLGGGTLSNDDVRSLNLAVEQQMLQLKTELNTQTRGLKTGHLLIDKAGYDDNLKEIEDWGSNIKAMVGDNAYMKVIADLNSEQTAEINFVAVEQYRVIAEINAGLGQAGVQSFLKIALRPEGPAKQLLIKASPFAADMFKQPDSFKQASSTGFNKIILPIPTNLIMSQAESLAVGSQLNDPINHKLLEVVLEKAATESGSTQSFESMIKGNPDSSKAMWGAKFKAWAAANEAKGNNVLDTTVSGLRKSFLSAYVSNNAAMPTSVTVTAPITTRRGEQVTGMFVASGDGIDVESGSIARNLFQVFTNNPTYLKKFGRDNGNPDMTAQEAMQHVLIGPPAFGPLGGGEEAVAKAREELDLVLSGNPTAEEEIVARRAFDEATTGIISGRAPKTKPAANRTEADVTKQQTQIDSLLERGISVSQIRTAIDNLVGDEEGTPFSPAAKAKLISALEEATGGSTNPKQFNQELVNKDATFGELGVFENSDGSVSTEVSITENVPALGGWVNIPTLVKGQIDPSGIAEGGDITPQQADIAVNRAIDRVKAGAKLRSFSSMEEALKAARGRSEEEKRSVINE